MEKQNYFVLQGKVIWRAETNYLFFKRVLLQILLEQNQEYYMLSEVVSHHQTIMESGFFKTTISPALPPCITYRPRKKDALFGVLVGESVELMFKGEMYSLEQYVTGCHRINPPIEIEMTSVLKLI